MRKCLAVLFLVVLSSCQLFLSKEEKTDKIVHDELQAIDWNNVEKYPLFVGECDEMAPKDTQKECFQTVLLRYFSEAMADLQFQVKQDLNDTIFVDFKIDQHGFILISNIEESTNVLNEIENFNALVSERLNDLTTVKAANYRGIPVNMRIRLPIVLNTQ